MLEEEISPEQLNELMAFDLVEPIGAIRNDFASAIIASTIANVNRDPEKTKPFTPEQFMPFLFVPEKDEEDILEEKKVNAQNMRGFIEMMNTAFGGRDKRLTNDFIPDK